MNSRVTITRDDKQVYVDGVAREIALCEQLPSYFHAIQWYGDRSPAYGEIEYAADAQGRKMPNTRFSDFSPYQAYVNAWEAAASPPQGE